MRCLSIWVNAAAGAALTLFIRGTANSKIGAWTVQVDLGERGKTSRLPLSYDDGFSYFQTKSATKEQLAAKYLGTEISQKLSAKVSEKADMSHKM